MKGVFYEFQYIAQKKKKTDLFPPNLLPHTNEFFFKIEKKKKKPTYL